MIYDALNFIKKLSLQKILNILKARVSFCISIWLKKSMVWGMPYSYSIEPTSLCNLTCPECPAGKGLMHRQTDEIPLKLYQSIIDQVFTNTCYLMLYLQGEPFLNKNIFLMIRYAYEKKIYTSLSTNGHFLEKSNAIKIIISGLDRMIVSVDGTTNDVYRQYRQGGDLDIVIEGIKNLVETKKSLKSKKPYIVLQFIVFKHNQHQINEFKVLGKALGANKTELKTAQLLDFENGHPMMTDFEQFSRYQKSGNKYIVKKPMRNFCKRIWTTGVILSDGLFIPCCYDKMAKYPLGDTKIDSLKSLWKGQPLVMFRKKILKNRKGTDICRNCDE